MRYLDLAMARRLGFAAWPCFLAFLASACRLDGRGTGDLVSGAGGSESPLTSSGSGVGGVPGTTSSASAGGAEDAGAGGGAGGAGGAPCPDAEALCDGRDDNCDGQIDGPDVCSDCNFASREGHAYLFCTQRKSWDEAKAYCNRHGYRFVVIDDAEENEWVFEHFDGDLGTDRWFIGVTDSAMDGRWRLDDGREAMYTQFRPVEPNGGTGENCAAMGYMGYQDDWDDISCSLRYAFVCEASGD